MRDYAGHLDQENSILQNTFFKQKWGGSRFSTSVPPFPQINPGSLVFIQRNSEQIGDGWRSLAAARALSRLKVHQRPAVSPKTQPVPVGPEDLDTLEDVFATIQLPIGLLNMDYAGNNVRNIAKAREVLANPAHAHGKQQSELKLLGFMHEGKLTVLGHAAAMWLTQMWEVVGRNGALRRPVIAAR
jgi:hypothetical protein